MNLPPSFQSLNNYLCIMLHLYNHIIDNLHFEMSIYTLKRWYLIFLRITYPSSNNQHLPSGNPSRESDSNCWMLGNFIIHIQDSSIIMKHYIIKLITSIFLPILIFSKINFEGFPIHMYIIHGLQHNTSMFLITNLFSIL